MKWLSYIGWFVAWFFIHSFIFVPIIHGGHGGLVTGVVAGINIFILVFGFSLISRKFKEPIVEDKKS